jgi:hypothetical protein
MYRLGRFVFRKGPKAVAAGEVAHRASAFGRGRRGGNGARGPSSPEPTIGDIGNFTQRPPGRLGGRFVWVRRTGIGGSYRLAALIAGANLDERQRRIRRHQGYRRKGLREAGGANRRPFRLEAGITDELLTAFSSLPRRPSKSLILWRPRPESNRGARICSPLRSHSATRPTEAEFALAPRAIASFERGKQGAISAIGPG